jgi:8-oxo-dGTP pyrophosphatase MutT (NUDIX family)
MNMNELTEIFRERKGKPIGYYKKSSVMILLQECDEEINVLFEVRANSLRHQPGDICLPGGKIDMNETPLEAAIRETKEELNINEDDFTVIGEMDYFISPYGSIMYPYVGVIHREIINPNKDEVDHIFKVPLIYFLNEQPFIYDMSIEPKLTEDFPYHLIRGGKDYNFSKGKLKQFFYQYNEYIIWGFTAYIINRFVEIIKELQ